MQVKGLANLVVPRLAEAECLSSLARTKGAAFTRDQHRKLLRDFVILRDGKRSMWSNESLLITIKRQHKKLLTPENTGGRLRTTGSYPSVCSVDCRMKYGGIIAKDFTFNRVLYV